MFKRTHKADYMAFNVALVKEVEKHPCLYDFNLKEYSSREIVQDTWKTIANNFNCTAKECRDTWKNLRIVFSRNLKKAPFSAKKKPYYLLESMRYLMPFMKIDTTSSTKQAKSKTEATYCETTSDEHISNRDEEEDYINPFNEQGAGIAEFELSIKQENDSSDETPRKKQKSHNADPSEIFTPETLLETPRKKQKLLDKTEDVAEINQCDCSKPKTSRTDAKHQFLMSLLPDLDDMSEVQFRSFRLEVCKLINQTFTPQLPPPPQSQFSGRNTSWNSFQYEPVVNLGIKHPETRNQH